MGKCNSRCMGCFGVRNIPVRSVDLHIYCVWVLRIKS